MTITLILVVAAIVLGPFLGTESRPDFIERPERGGQFRPLG
jgi:hypothetical protein